MDEGTERQLVRVWMLGVLLWGGVTSSKGTRAWELRTTSVPFLVHG
jgi:hypothetical protein